tara:strand:- start:7 stop:267 length:261 start_codon:yes stop_codon:yes gene_type:complete
MLLYFILDWSTDIIFWIIKNLGKTSYYSICYIFGYGYNDNNKEDIDTLKELIEQKKDINEIKKLLEKLSNKSDKTESDKIESDKTE